MHISLFYRFFHYRTSFVTETIRPQQVVLTNANNCKVEGDSDDALSNPSHCFAFYLEDKFVESSSGSELDCCWTADHISSLPKPLVGRVVVHPNSTMHACHHYLSFISSVKSTMNLFSDVAYMQGENFEQFMVPLMSPFQNLIQFWIMPFEERCKDNMTYLFCQK